MGLGVPCAPMLSVEQALALDHTATRQMSATLGKYEVTGIPVKLDRTPGSLRLPPPQIGEHTDAVLKRFGFSEAEIAAALNAGAVKQA